MNKISHTCTGQRYLDPNALRETHIYSTIPASLPPCVERPREVISRLASIARTPTSWPLYKPQMETGKRTNQHRRNPQARLGTKGKETKWSPTEHSLSRQLIWIRRALLKIKYRDIISLFRFINQRKANLNLHVNIQWKSDQYTLLTDGKISVFFNCFGGHSIQRDRLLISVSRHYGAVSLPRGRGDGKGICRIHTQRWYSRVILARYSRGSWESEVRFSTNFLVLVILIRF